MLFTADALLNRHRSAPIHNVRRYYPMTQGPGSAPFRKCVTDAEGWIVSFWDDVIAATVVDVLLATSLPFKLNVKLIRSTRSCPGGWNSDLPGWGIVYCTHRRCAVGLFRSLKKTESKFFLFVSGLRVALVTTCLPLRPAFGVLGFRFLKHRLPLNLRGPPILITLYGAKILISNWLTRLFESMSLMTAAIELARQHRWQMQYRPRGDTHNGHQALESDLG